MKNILGDDYPDTLTSMNNLAVMYREQGNFTEPAKMHGEVLEKERRSWRMTTLPC